MDEAILLAVNGLHTPSLDPIVTLLSDYGLYAFLVALALRAIATRTGRDLEAMRDGWLAFFVTLFVSETILKPIVMRPRPTTITALAEHLHVLGRVPPVTSTSFPSGTSAACACATAWIAMRFGWRPAILAGAYTLLVSLGRLYAGVHWPSDLLGGWVVGVLVAIGIDRLTRWIAIRPSDAPLSR